MKKNIAILLALLLILSMAVPAAAVTPPQDTPASPTVPDISDGIHVEIPDEVFDDWFDEHPIVIEPTVEPTEAPTEPVEEDEPTRTDWRDWLSGWRQWWQKIKNGTSGMDGKCGPKTWAALPGWV